jgi:hypothetical protein
MAGESPLIPAIIYIYPLAGAGPFYDNAIRFLHSYHERPPGMDHQTCIVCNGAPADDETKFLFSSLPNVRFLEHSNAGQDIGAYQLAAQQVPCDVMVFFGASTYFRRSGWLVRMMEVYSKYGPDHLYGCTGNQGDARFNVWPHVRTTAFFCSPHHINAHPMRVTGMGEHQRYSYEHGEHGLTQWFLKDNRRAWILAWDGVWPLQQCDQIPGGFHNANQENVVVGDRLTCEPYYHCQ